MILALCVLAFSARGSDGSNEIPLVRAEQISTQEQSSSADKAIDNDLNTAAVTGGKAYTWLKVYFTTVSNVEKVVIEKGESRATLCAYTVSVVDQGSKTLCGGYTGKNGNYAEEVHCNGISGDSVILEASACTRNLRIFEISVYGTDPGKH